jgi:recombination protein RecT
MQNNNSFAGNYFQPASQKQLDFLKRLGYTGDLEGMTSGEASTLINQLQANQPKQQAQQQPVPQNNQAPVPQINQNQVMSIVRDTELATNLVSNLTDLANNGQLYIPENYSVGNALKSAMSKILTSEQSGKLLACTVESKTQALTEYVVQGLDASKNQAYFIPYGDKMQMMRSYFGDVAVTKSTGLVQDVYAIVIYEGDEIVIGFDDYGRETLVNHVTKFENRDNPIKGAYAVAVGINGYKAYCFMTMKEIQASWSMSKAPADKNKFQTNFQQEAAKRTVIRRLVKMIFNSSENTTERQTALIGSYNRTTADEYDNTQDVSDEMKHNSINAVHSEQRVRNASVTPNISFDTQTGEINQPNEEDWMNQ